MVMRRGDARHKDVPDPLDAGPKRITTIHAQRKFAQGSGMNSPVMSPIKEKEKAKVNGGATDSSPSSSPSTSGGPSKRPRTEDFITFLCYRGTPYLPSELNYFNVPSKPDKNDREAASPALTSKQIASPSRQQDKEDKLKRAKQNKRIAMQSKSKVLDQRQRKSRINAIAQKGKVVKSKAQTPISKDRLKKAVVATVASNRNALKSRTPIVRASHPAILKRLGASRARAGLRSSGQLPPGSDVGIHTDRKPRHDKGNLLKNKNKLPATSRNRGKVTTPSRMQHKRGPKGVPVTPASLRLKRGKVIKGTPQGKAHPKSLNLAARPSRKTKEAATLYMEMITKDLRSPDDDDEDMSPLVGPRGIEMNATPKTRTRSGTAEETSLAVPRKKTVSKANSILSPGPSPPTVRRSLKVSTTPSPVMKRTRGSGKEDASNIDSLNSSPVRGRTGKKAAGDEAAVPATSANLRQRGSRGGKKPTKKVSQKVGGPSDLEESSHGEGEGEDEDDEDNSSRRPASKKSKKSNALSEPEKAIAVKKPFQKKNDPEVPKKVTKVSEVEPAQGKKRATRSSGVDTPQESDKAPEKDKKQASGKSKLQGQSTKKSPGSESEDADESKNKPPVKKTRHSAKKAESDSEEESEAQIKPTAKRTRQSRSSTKAQEAEEGKKEKPQIQTRTAKPPKSGKSEDSASENEVESPVTRKPGRPKKSSLDEAGKPTSDAQIKKVAKKSVQHDDKSTKDNMKPTRRGIEPKQDESDSDSDSNTKDESLVRRTRASKVVEAVDLEASKNAPKSKRARASGTQPGKSEENSGSEDILSKKMKRSSKPEVNVEVPEVPQKDEIPKIPTSRNSLPIRQASLKSDTEMEETPKPLKKLKQSIKIESGGESDKEGKSTKGKKPKTDDADKEPNAKLGAKTTSKTVVKVEFKEEAAPKRSSRSGQSIDVDIDVESKAKPAKMDKDPPVPVKRGRKPKPVQQPEDFDKDPVEQKTEEDAAKRPPNKRGRKPKVREPLSNDKKEGTRQTRKSGGDDSLKDLSSEVKKVSVTNQTILSKNVTKKSDSRASEMSESENQETSDVDTPVRAKRGRKPKKVEESETDEEKPLEKKTRPRRSTRTVVKRESYSEFSDEDIDDIDEDFEDDIAPRRTRGRKANVKYTEHDTDDSNPAESEAEIRPRRSRRSVFSTQLPIDSDSDIEDSFVDVPSSSRTKKVKSETEVDPEEVDEEERKPKLASPKEAKSQTRKIPASAEDKVMPNGTESTDNKSLIKTAEKLKSDDGALSDSSKKSKASKSSKMPRTAEEVKTSTESSKLPLQPRVATGTVRELKTNLASSKPPGDGSDHLIVGEEEALGPRGEVEQLLAVTTAEIQVVAQEPKRNTRRLSRDKPEVPEENKFDLKTPDQVSVQSIENPSMTPTGSFDLSAPSKDYDNNNGLAILSDVAFSELQNRKNIMGRKLSSDSATSFSSDEVPTLPVRKDKVVPKAKADLPTVREKTESDEEISDEMDEGSPYEEYGKSEKLRRKRLPKRTMKEPARQVPQRPVRNRRAKLASYIDDESFSSDRSSSPEIPTKAVQKKRRKSEDKLLEISTASVPPQKSVIPVVSSSATTALSAVPSVASVPTSLKEPVPLAKPKEAKQPSQPKGEPPKVSGVQRSVEVKKPVPKPANQILTVPRPLQPAKEVTEMKKDNSITLFSGVSGVPVMKSDIRLMPVQPHREVSPQIAQAKRPTPEALAKPPPYVPSRPTVSSSQSFSKGSLSNMKTAPDITISSSEVKAKPNTLDTWKNAFINAKIPKPGQLSPAHHSSAGTPFMRKTFSNSPKTPTKPEEKPTAFVPTKLPGVQTFKTSAFQNLGKLGNQSPSRMPGGMSPGRPPVSSLAEPKPQVYLSPSRVKNSPSKDERPEPKKPAETPPKSLTLLQYEKRSQEVVSSLKGSQPVLVDGVQSYVPAFPTKLKEYSMEKAKVAQARQPPVQAPPPEETAKTESGKHTNLPFAVDSALRKRSPITVKKPVKAVEKKAVPTITIPEVTSAPATAPSLPEPSTSALANPTAKLELLSKKKVQMTNEEIKKWLDDSTSTGVEHAKDCGIFENNQCECSYRTSGESMLNSSVGTIKEDPKIDHGVVEPPVQLKELDSGAKFTAETISTCKVEEYKEKMLQKTPKPQTTETDKELIPPGVPKAKKPMNLTVEKAKRKSSMTEDEMCEYGFRFERNANSSRESGSDMSSPTPRDDVSSSNEEKFDGSPGERKSIFLQRRQKSPAVAPPSRKPLSKSPCAFSAENESSVYAFEDAPPPAVNNPFRRRGSRNKSSEDDGPASSSIAVQVNLETSAAGDAEQVLECSTQTEQVDSDGQLFYFPLEGDSNPQEVIQGVQVKLQSSEGPEQKVIMKAKLVTKPSPTGPAPPSKSVRPLCDAGRLSQRPEQKVRPLASTSTATQSKPPVGTVTPTIREQPSCSTSVNSQGTATSDRPELTNQSTQAAAIPQVLPLPSPLPTAPASDPVKAEPSPAAAAPKPSPKSAVTTSTPRRSSPNEFPVPGTTPKMVDALTFYPTEKDFQDPLEYIERITPQAQSFGICRIVPPSSFKPECKVSDDMRFTAYNQYVHKMLYRWGPNVREMTAIKKYLATQSIPLKQPPYIGGMEIDLPRLYQTVQSCGGLKEVIEKKRWAKVADAMRIPKAAQDRVTKLDDLYCKYLLPYDTLSHAERSKLLEEVDMEWTERERRIALEAERESKGEKEEKEENSDSEEESDDGRDECITKGKTMPLSGFYRVARNTMAMWFKEPNPSSKEVENEYWKQVTSRKQHVCVNSGSIDSGSYGYGFPTSKSSSTSRHPWNLKVLTNNSGSILRSMGPVMGITVPTLHVGMLFSACCWYRDPHGLPWIEYLHTGANKIWYAVPDLWNDELHGAMRTILPRYCQDKPIWLASDTAMVPPDLLVQQGVSLCRAVQEPGQFILVFPKAFTSTICTGYIVSESVYFAQPSWLNNAKQIFKDIQESCEPPVFSLERLLFNIATDVRSTAEVLTQVLPMIIELRDTELRYREQLRELGVTETERLAVSKGGRKKSQEEPEEYECELCRGNLYLSLVTNTVEEANFCLLHAVESLTKDRSHVKNCKLMYSYDEEEMNEVLEKMKQRIETKSGKKQNSKSTGGSSKA